MKRPRTLVIAHGDKGGCGKSTLACIAVEYALQRGLAVAVIEGDVQIHDVRDRYADTEVAVLSVDLDKSGGDAANALSSLFRHVEDTETDFLVMNSPANGHKILDAQAEILLPVARELGFQVCTAWMVGTDAASAALAHRSALCRGSDRRMAVINRHASAYDPDYVWFTEPQHREAWLASGGLVGEIPVLASRVAARIKDLPGRTLGELASRESPLYIIDRQILRDWLRRSWTQALAPLLGDTDDGR